MDVHQTITDPKLREKLAVILKRENPNAPNEPPWEWVNEMTETEYWQEYRALPATICQYCKHPKYPVYSVQLGDMVNVHPTPELFLSCLTMKAMLDQ